MPITPNNIQSQVFGGEKQFSQQAPSQANDLQKQAFKRSLANFEASQPDGNLSQGTANNEQGQKPNDEGQIASQVRHQPQYNSNITVMINQYGPTINQQVKEEEGQNQSAKQKVTTEQYAQEAIQNLLPSKQGSLKKAEQLKMQPAGTASATFKSQFKPQSIGTLNFQQKFQQVLNSKGVTPSNQHAPLISASNLLMNQGFVQQHLGAFQGGQNQQAAGRDYSTLQQRLFAGTPRLFIGNQQQKMPTSTTAATAAAFLAQHGHQFVEPLKSTRNLHSKETFAGQVG